MFGLQASFVLGLVTALDPVLSSSSVARFLLGVSRFCATASFQSSWSRILQDGGDPPGLLILPALWVNDESTLWLIVLNGRPGKTSQVSAKWARWHGVCYTLLRLEIEEVVEEQSAETQNTTPNSYSMGPS
ncbi:hypothetical protein GWK47_012641 [Chionoecetes opilio]|uniref:Secreted protein n=1 Tax=Chionoecetes opilio TaxID=41210 RepID=A0A8J4Y5B7_CHIOP|nr:hypothetical protein GWK47_012641 [Chionoecetes opilio]